MSISTCTCSQRHQIQLCSSHDLVARLLAANRTPARCRFERSPDDSDERWPKPESERLPERKDASVMQRGLDFRTIGGPLFSPNFQVSIYLSRALQYPIVFSRVEAFSLVGPLRTSHLMYERGLDPH
ncbi:unnamed protein product [Chondrus crispus]|uniref:Uncharacterized protein n=1 Tax=Chondrus crispus TaxID=2769 RepID=R7QQU0_CHOCR|nr:unnamed protein product [Chondrus crispus]CDF39851.1 unnamed protein product [Chondrus crispus]|eukprot:XP_005710145.1 unnamed protein product [Chondrus crispus]